MSFADLSRPKAKGLLLTLLASLLAICALIGSSFTRSVRAQGKEDLALTLVPSVYSIEARSGKNTHLVLEVRNTGTTTITGIELSVASPNGWTVSLDPGEIVGLAPGAVSRFSADVRPAPSATKGEYQISFTASADGIQRMVFLQVTVKPASYWLWVVFAIAAAVATVFVVVFVRARRRG